MKECCAKRFATPRKRSAVLRKQKAEREALPLFADQVAALQPSVDEVMSRRAQRADVVEVERRQFTAKWWRIARQTYFGLPAEQKAKVQVRWHRWPSVPRTGADRTRGR